MYVPILNKSDGVHSNRVSKLGLPAILRKVAAEYRDTTDLSSEARKKQILGQARTEIIKNIRKTK